MERERFLLCFHLDWSPCYFSSSSLSLRRTTMKCFTCGPKKAPQTCQIQHVYSGLYGLLSVPKKISPQDIFAGQEQNDLLNFSSFGELFHRTKNLSITLQLDRESVDIIYHNVEISLEAFPNDPQENKIISSLLGPEGRVQSYSCHVTTAQAPCGK